MNGVHQSCFNSNSSATRNPELTSEGAALCQTQVAAARRRCQRCFRLQARGRLLHAVTAGDGLYHEASSCASSASSSASSSSPRSPRSSECRASILAISLRHRTASSHASSAQETATIQIRFCCSVEKLVHSTVCYVGLTARCTQHGHEHPFLGGPVENHCR